jgi:hypothetical protein
MAFNPLEQKGIPIDQQLRTWSELNVQPYDKLQVDPYTRCRVIVMNGIEVEAAMFSHQFNRHTDVPEIKEALAQSRRVEQQQQKAVNWLTPADETTLEVTIGYEQTAIDLTAWIARNEADPYLKQSMEFGLLEDFDHLYRYSNLYELIEGKQAEQVVKHLTEITPGRPTVEEHRHPVDDLRRHYDKHTAEPQSKLNSLILVAAEQQTMNFYMNMGNRYLEPIARGLYQEIGMIEEQHVTQYESLLDPAQSWLELWVMHEYMEVYLYWSFSQQETDPRIKALWQLHLDMEIEQLRTACELMRRFDGREPEELLPPALPQPLQFEPNKEYVRSVLAHQVDFSADKLDITMTRPPRFEAYQSAVHDDGAVPSEQVIEENRRRSGREYRLETEGPNPVERLQEKV